MEIIKNMYNIIETNNITKSYRTEEVETTALNQINMKVRNGEFVAIMGPSGCGKSTLLNVMGLLDDFDSGEYVFLQKNISTLNKKEKSELRMKSIGFVFQNYNLIDELTVFENIELPLKYLNISKGERTTRVEEILDKMGISHRRNHYPNQLSGGQQQRVAVSRAVINDPKIILADEPTGNLDSKHGNEVMDLLTSLNENGTTVIMVTHSEHDASFAHRTIKLLDGEIVSENNLTSTGSLA